MCPYSKPSHSYSSTAVITVQLSKRQKLDLISGEMRLIKICQHIAYFENHILSFIKKLTTNICGCDRTTKNIQLKDLLLLLIKATCFAQHLYSYNHKHFWLIFCSCQLRKKGCTAIFDWFILIFISCSKYMVLAYISTNKKVLGLIVCKFCFTSSVSCHNPKHIGQMYWKLNFPWVWMQICMQWLYVWALWRLSTYPECFYGCTDSSKWVETDGQLSKWNAISLVFVH